MKKAILAVLLAFLLVVTVGIVYFFYTTSGARFVLTSLPSIAGYQVHVGVIEGRLADTLTVKCLRLEWKDGRADIDSLYLSWRASRLLWATVAVDTLRIEGVSVKTGRKEKKPVNLAWPRIPGILARITAWVKDFSIKDIKYVRDQDSPIIIHAIDSPVVWHGGTLVLKQLKVTSPYGMLEGDLRAGFYTALLKARLTLVPVRPADGIDRLLLVADLQEGKGQDQLSGPLTVSLREDETDVVRIENRVALRKQEIIVYSMDARISGAKGNIGGEGEVVFRTEEPAFSARLRFNDFHFERLAPIDTVNGTAAVEGTVSAYKGNFSLTHRGEQWQNAGLAGSFKGNNREAQGIVNGKWLDGTISSDVDVAWKDGIAATVQMTARGLDPKGIDPEWYGRINADMRAAVRKTGDQPLEANISARLPESTLRGRTLTGELDSDVRGEEIRITRLILRGDVFDFYAQGLLSRKIDFRARVTDLSGLVPHSAGSFDAEGWVRRVRGSASGGLRGTASKIAVGDVQIRNMQLDAALPDGRDEKIHLVTSFREGTYKGVQVDRAKAVLTGTKKGHQLDFSTGGGSWAIRALLEGSYANEKWQGVLAEMRGFDKNHGPWSLQRPATITVSREQVRFTPVVLTSPIGESLALAADLGLQPFKGPMKAEWKGLRLSRLDPFLEGPKVRGESTGNVSVTWLDRDRFNLSGATAFSGSFTGKGLPVVEVSRGETNFKWDAKGLAASWEIALVKEGAFEGNFSSPDGPRLSLPDQGRLAATWRSVDLALLRPFFPPGFSLTGRLSGNVKGSLMPRSRLALDGRTGITSGTVSWKTGDRLVTTPITRAQMSAVWQNDQLEGDVDVQVEKYGNLRFAGFLPLPARLPIRIDPSGRLDATLESSINDLSLIEAFLPGVRTTKGRVTLSARGNGTWESPRLQGSAAMRNVSIYLDRPRLHLDNLSADARFSRDEKSTSAALSALLGRAGRLDGRFSSSTSSGFTLPEEGELVASWQALDLALLTPLFPDAEVKGLISGEARGNLLKGGIVDLTARTNSLNGCAVVVRGAKGAFAIQVQSVSAEAAWRGEDVRGDVSLVLTNYGKAKGSFVLPVPARLPFRLVPSGPIDIVLQARMRERGLISALMPGIARETEGRLDVNARANGTWEYPRLSGGARLTEAGAYIPQAGITLKNLNLVTEFSEDQVRITSFRVESGPGNLQGEGTIRLDAWRIAGYEGVLKGDSFQAVFLPEIRGQVTPDLTVEGSLKEVTVRGDVRIPRLQIFDTVGENVVRPSPDVVIVDAETDKKKRGLPFAVDVKVQVHLGDQVSIRMRGLDARLGGRLAVSAAGAEDVSVQGKINVVKGSYKAYGVDLQITRGNIIFTGPPERPTLDVQASRQVEDVVAGVEVTGTASNPVVNLYSRPPLPDSDKLAYIVLGRPLRGDAAQSAILMQAASTLISRGAGGDKGTGIEERLKGMLGLDVLQFGPATTGFGTAAGTAAVGTGPIGTPASPGTLPTQTATSPAGDAASTAVTLGRYLSPKLYISFGRSLFTNQNLVILRYTLTRNIEVETRTGTESGADIFYKIQFD